MSATTIIRTARHIAAATALALAIVPAAQAASADSAKPVVDTNPAHARIINGSVAADGSWPFIVSLRSASTGGHFCGGTVIAPNLILTAAHCVTQPKTAIKVSPSSLYVVAKQTRLNQGTGETLRVASIVTHPSYQPGVFSGDAALLFLSSRTTAPPIALADYAFETSALNVGAWEWTAGWGSTTPNQPNNGGYGASYPNSLMQTALHIYTPAACNTYYGVTSFTNWNLCVGNTNSTFCNGDSGGPHVVQAADGTWRLIGITSFTLFSSDAAGNQWACQKNYAAVERVAAITDWIIATARSGGATASADTGSQLGDFTAPSLTLKAQKAKAKHAFKVIYTVLDNSKVSAETLIVKKGARTVAVSRTAFGSATGGRYSIRIRGLAKGTYQLRLTSRDKAGNVSRVYVAKLRVK
jgi:secreted trypsin-like serine protease